MRTMFCGMLFLTNLSFAATPICGWYGSVFGGYAYLPGNINRYAAAGFYNNSHFNSGYDAGGSLGFKTTSPLRYEAELTYINSEPSQFSINSIPQSQISGQSTDTQITANVYYDFPDYSPTLAPFIGAGLGYAWVSTKLTSNGPSVPTYFKAANSLLAFQGIVGLTYNFDENYALNISYRYLRTTNADDFGKAFQANLFNVGVIYRFDGFLY